MLTLLNYRVLETSTAAIFLSNGHLISLYAPIYLGWTSSLISFVWDQSTCQERVESDKIQNEKFLPRVELEPTTLRSAVWCYWATRALLKAVLFSWIQCRMTSSSKSWIFTIFNKLLWIFKCHLLLLSVIKQMRWVVIKKPVLCQ